MNFFKWMMLGQLLLLGACSSSPEKCADKNFYTQLRCEIQRDTQLHSKK